jgi:hypothetical protein
LGPYTDFFVAVCGAVFFVRAAKFERRSPAMWCALSLVTSALTVALGGGWFSMVFAQVVLLMAIAVFRAATEKD